MPRNRVYLVGAIIYLYDLTSIGDTVLKKLNSKNKDHLSLLHIYIIHINVASISRYCTFHEIDSIYVDFVK